MAQSNALQAFGGAPQLSVVDKAKATIAKALLYEPAVQAKPASPRSPSWIRRFSS